MKYLLDTNICIYLIRQRPIEVIERLEQTKIQDIAISTITLSELEYGVENSSRPLQNRLALMEFMAPFHVLDFDGEAATFYGKIRAELQKKGTPIGAMDLLIAAHALAQNLILVTNNEKEFRRVDGLKVENWV